VKIYVRTYLYSHERSKVAVFPYRVNAAYLKLEDALGNMVAPMFQSVTGSNGVTHIFVDRDGSLEPYATVSEVDFFAEGKDE